MPDIGRYTVHVNTDLSPTRALVILSPRARAIATPSEVVFIAEGDAVAQWRALDGQTVPLRAEVG